MIALLECAVDCTGTFSAACHLIVHSSSGFVELLGDTFEGTDRKTDRHLDDFCNVCVVKERLSGFVLKLLYSKFVALACMFQLSDVDQC